MDAPQKVAVFATFLFFRGGISNVLTYYIGAGCAKDRERNYVQKNVHVFMIFYIIGVANTKSENIAIWMIR